MLTSIAMLGCTMGICGANAETLESTSIGLREWEGPKAKHGIGPRTREETLWIEPILDGYKAPNVRVLVSDTNEGNGPVLAPMGTAPIFEDGHLLDLLPNVLVKARLQCVMGAVVRNVNAHGVVLLAQEGGRVPDVTHNDAVVVVRIAKQGRVEVT